MRLLWRKWPDDEKALATRDAFLWGEHMLVAPVVDQGATKEELSLPQGLGSDFWTNARQDGIHVISRDVDLSHWTYDDRHVMS
jgi:alpha-glucosidase